ncbi:unnamed protein product, partial [Laminaria digitata]
MSLDGDSEVAVGITLSFTPGASFQGWEGGHLFRGKIRLYESRNKDVVKELPCLAQVYSSAPAYHAALTPSASPSVDDDVEEREALSPLPPTPDGGGRGRKSSARMALLPPRSPSDSSSNANSSPVPSFFTTVSGGGMASASSLGL